MDQYLLIPFLGEWTSIYQLFWCSPGVQGFDTLPYVELWWFKGFAIYPSQLQSLSTNQYKTWNRFSPLAAGWPPSNKCFHSSLWMFMKHQSLGLNITCMNHEVSSTGRRLEVSTLVPTSNMRRPAVPSVPGRVEATCWCGWIVPSWETRNATGQNMAAVTGGGMADGMDLTFWWRYGSRSHLWNCVFFVFVRH